MEDNWLKSSINLTPPVQRWGRGWSICRLWGCKSGNCNRPGRVLRRASRRTTGRAGRVFRCGWLFHRGSSRKPPRSFPIRRRFPSRFCWSLFHSSKGHCPAPKPGGGWPPVPEGPTTACEARYGCWAGLQRILAIPLFYVGLATFFHRVTMKNEVSIYRNLCIQVMDI